MANERANTDKSLFYTEQTIMLLKAEIQEESATAKSIGNFSTNALLYGAWLSLCETLKYWQVELLSVSGIKSANTLAFSVDAFLQEEYADYPEFQYLRNLNQTPNSWLYQLIQYSKQPSMLLDVVARPAPTQPSEQTAVSEEADNRITMIDVSMIPSASVDEDQGPGNQTEKLTSAVAQFKTYMSDVRERHSEW